MTNIDISMLLPTRGRPQNIRRYLQSINKTISKNYNIEILFYIDDDDEESIDCIEEMLSIYKNLNVGYHIGRRIIMSDMTQLLYERYSSGQYLYLCGDDIQFETKNWDVIVIDEFKKFPDDILLCGFQDGYNTNTITHPIISRKFAECIGYCVPAGWKGDYVDTYLGDIARKIDRHVWLDGMVRHIHFAAGLATIDKTMQEKLARCYNSGKPSNVEFDESLAARDLAVEKLIKYIEDCKNVNS